MHSATKVGSPCGTFDAPCRAEHVILPQALFRPCFTHLLRNEQLRQPALLYHPCRLCTDQPRLPHGTLSHGSPDARLFRYLAGGVETRRNPLAWTEQSRHFRYPRQSGSPGPGEFCATSRVSRSRACSSCRGRWATPASQARHVSCCQSGSPGPASSCVFPGVPLTCVLLLPGPGGPLWQAVSRVRVARRAPASSARFSRPPCSRVCSSAGGPVGHSGRRCVRVRAGSPGPGESAASFRASRSRVCSSRRGPAGHSGRRCVRVRVARRAPAGSGAFFRVSRSRVCSSPAGARRATLAGDVPPRQSGSPGPGEFSAAFSRPSRSRVLLPPGPGAGHSGKRCVRVRVARRAPASSCGVFPSVPLTCVPLPPGPAGHSGRRCVRVRVARRAPASSWCLSEAPSPLTCVPPLPAWGPRPGPHSGKHVSAVRVARRAPASSCVFPSVPLTVCAPPAGARWAHSGRRCVRVRAARRAPGQSRVFPGPPLTYVLPPAGARWATLAGDVSASEWLAGPR